MKPVIHNPAARVALALGLVVGAGLAVPSAAVRADDIVLAQADAAPQEMPVSYTSEQADRGEDKFKSECEECHGDDLKGGLNGGAPLTGMMFDQKYVDGAPASWLFEFMSTQMPPNAPGRYSASTYADLMAYILKKNGFQPGSSELPSDLDTLDNVMMVK